MERRWKECKEAKRKANMEEKGKDERDEQVEERR